MTIANEKTLSPEAVKRQIATILPAIDQHDEIVEHVAPDELRVRLPFRDAFMGNDRWQDTGAGVFSGPTVMGLADTAMYGCVHGTYGHDVCTVMQTFNIAFLRPAGTADLLAEARIVRHGKRSLYLECYLTSDGETEPAAHITAVYSIRRIS